MKNLFNSACVFLLLALAHLSVYAQPAISSFSPASGAVGTVVTITGTNLTAPTALTIGGVSAIVVSNTGSTLVAMLMPGAVTGKVAITTSGGTASSSSNFTVTATLYTNDQQGNKLVGAGAIGAAEQGQAVAISADGNTAIVGGDQDSTGRGAAWIFTRTGNIWSPLGYKLVGAGASGLASQGHAVAISADGNTALVGGYGDSSGLGALWVFTRSGAVWTQQGGKLTGAGATGAAGLGYSVSLSADGNTALAAGPYDNGDIGATWVFTRSGTTWSQQGNKLTGTGAIGAAYQGWGVSISANGTTAIVGGPGDNGFTGAAWIFTRSGNTWAQQGGKLVGSGLAGVSFQGQAVSLSADGNTAVVGAPFDNNGLGAIWAYTRSGTAWAQQGGKLTATGSTTNENFGWSASLSADGNTALIGAVGDNSGGAAMIFTRSGAAWQQADKITGTGVSNKDGGSGEGGSVMISANGNTAIIGAPYDAADIGSALIFTYSPPPAITSFSPSSGPVGTLVTIKGSNLGNLNTLTIGGITAIQVSNAGTSMVCLVMPGTVTGKVSASAAGSTATSTHTFTVTSTPYPSVQQGSPLAGTGGSTISTTGGAEQGYSVAVSADGNTAVIGGVGNNGYKGAIWIFTRKDTTWSQQGGKLIGTNGSSQANEGYSVAISADGNTVIEGGPNEKIGQNYVGAAWVFTRTGTKWSQQAEIPGASDNVSLSADGNTALMDNVVYVRSGTTWEWEAYLQGGGSIGAISADGNTAIINGTLGSGIAAAALVFIRTGNTWAQQGGELQGSGAVNVGLPSDWSYPTGGQSLALSADGNTAMIGGPTDNQSIGAAWIFTRSNGVWSQQAKLVGSGYQETNGVPIFEGGSVALSADGNTAVIAGPYDNEFTGAAWVFTRSGSNWTPRGNKLVGQGGGGYEGLGLGLSANGTTAILGAWDNNYAYGASWVFVPTTEADMPESVKNDNKMDDDTTSGPAVGLSAPFSLLAYPNPFAGKFNLAISSQSDDIINVNVYNVYGERVLATQTDGAKTFSPELGSNYSPGIYIVQVKQGENSQQIKVVKSE